MIHVLATVELQPGKREEFLAAFHRVVPLVLAEEGCLEYGPTVDATTDLLPAGTARPDVVVVVEKWSSLDALRSHMTAAHMTDYRAQVKSLVTGTRLQILEPA